MKHLLYASRTFLIIVVAAVIIMTIVGVDIESPAIEPNNKTCELL